MKRPWVLSAASSSDIEKMRSRDTPGKLRCHSTRRSCSLLGRDCGVWAAAARAVLKAGADPIAARERAQAQAQIEAAQAVAKAMTFDQCAAAYIASQQAAWRNPKHRQQWANTLKTYVSPVFGSLPVAAIDTDLVVAALQRDALWTTKPETAGRVRGRIEAILDWAKVLKFRTGDNPARWKGQLSIMLPKRSKLRAVKHHAALDYNELPTFMRALALRQATAASALRFVILTAARTSEASSRALSTSRPPSTAFSPSTTGHPNPSSGPPTRTKSSPPPIVDTKCCTQSASDPTPSNGARYSAPLNCP